MRCGLADVHCGNTDIILLLMDLVANKRHGNGTVFVEKTGNYSRNSRVDILDRVTAILNLLLQIRQKWSNFYYF